MIGDNLKEIHLEGLNPDGVPSVLGNYVHPFKFNDLKFQGSFLALRIEGDKLSIEERIKVLTNELELKNLNTSILDVHQSVPLWKKINKATIYI